ncbi:hypothetical protein B6N60_02212 [Richelia sinica FACHB-800]|uniref:Uncharacterized protein n=1 Tax=Richelia sinica FACHB-800 TaxID=1357546 RepID=A0A975T8Q0_9NOST|nr:hypothetical protein [Richelia sinica]MBD2666161.1 hypothetical protein [Richelia sinica FACHB-800]QXE23522.1 hypothetical protein B6N60_02212 [Richelia sinica FACHB-800]
MAKIKINDLQVDDVDKFLTNINNIESQFIFGGEHTSVYQVLNYGVKALEFALAIYAIDTITLLTKSFKT